ncbi:MAG: GGDEF domain-containing protein [Pseudomonadota bacterium]
MKISSRPTNNRAASRRTLPAADTANSVNDPATRTRSLTATTTDEDTVAIAGIPASELTPHVQAALQKLMAEITSLRQSVAQLKDQVKAAETQADQDPLLPVLNRRAFMRDLDRALAFARRYGTRATVAFIDVDGLKGINDHHGHAAGDAVLSHMVTTISDNIRSGDSFGRLGGDEFGLLLVQTDEALAAKKMESLSRCVSQSPVKVDDAMVQVQISFGLAALASQGADTQHTAETLLALADQRMYEQKSTRSVTR